MNFIRFEETAIIDCKLIECDKCNAVKIGRKVNTDQFIKELIESGWTADVTGLIKCRRCKEKEV